jgi:hypothetical protein
MLEAGQPISDQVGIYGLSRTLRLAIEVPQRLRETLNRANEAMQGTSELIENLQNSEVRRNAMTGLNMALGQQELQQGPLAPLAPAVRAVLGVGDQDGDATKAKSQRIQVVRSGGRVQVPSSRKSTTTGSKQSNRQSDNEASASSQRQKPIKKSAAPIKVSKPTGSSSSKIAKPVVNTSVRLRRQSESAEKPASEPATTPARNGNDQSQFILTELEKNLNGNSLEPAHNEEAANREPARRLTVRKKSSNPAQKNGSSTDTNATNDTNTSSQDLNHRAPADGSENDESTTLS